MTETSTADATVARSSIDPTGALGRVTDRVAARLIDAVERDDAEVRPVGREPLGRDHRRQQLLVGAWIGDDPFDVDEIAAYVAAHASVTLESATTIAVDPLSAMVLAGRTGVSAKRLSRLPLLRSIAPLADLLAAATAARSEAPFEGASAT